LKRSFRAHKHESKEEVCFPSFDAIVKAEIRDDSREHRALIHTELRFCTKIGCLGRQISLYFVLAQCETVLRRANVVNVLETHANRDFREDFFRASTFRERARRVASLESGALWRKRQNSCMHARKK
jgi:hypothetical protein